MIVLTQTQKDAIVKAEKINKEVDALLGQIDDLLSPIADLVIGSTDVVAIRALADSFPSGFYRTELRTLARVLEMAAAK